MGIEPDEEAVRAGNARGVKIVAHHLYELPASFDGTFERIMLSHVIEHVRDPIAMLSRCRQLLAPGGTLWLETLNLSGVGHEERGADWRGLEPPRHLERSVETQQRRLRLTVPAAVTSASAAVPASDESETLQQRLQRPRDIVEKNLERAEFLTLTATA
jgi:2-polyprenyl-3-methyl-5-hydroxy-6-metoxy-1,4-benzoquinol methylase